MRVTFPLDRARGSSRARLLVLIPAVGDYVNAELLGKSQDAHDRQRHPGPLPEPERLPTASALSFILMAAILVAIVIYARALGTDELSARRGMSADPRPVPADGQAMAADPRPAAAAQERRSRRTLRRLDHWVLPVFTVLAIGYLLMPIVVMIIFSFNDPVGRFNYHWNEFSLDGLA